MYNYWYPVRSSRTGFLAVTSCYTRIPLLSGKEILKIACVSYNKKRPTTAFDWIVLTNQGEFVVSQKTHLYNPKDYGKVKDICMSAPTDWSRKFGLLNEEGK